MRCLPAKTRRSSVCGMLVRRATTARSCATVIDCEMVRGNAINVSARLYTFMWYRCYEDSLSPEIFLTKICIISSASVEEERDEDEHVDEKLLDRISVEMTGFDTAGWSR